MHDNHLFAAKLRPDETTLHMLVVDDNALNRVLATRMLLGVLKSKNIPVVIEKAVNGLEAVNLVKAHLDEHHQNYDLIVMDNEMPEMKGTEATNKIRELEQEKGIASIDCSYIASWSSTHLEPFKGADTSLTKPLKQNELTQAVDEMLSQKFQNNPSPRAI